MANANGRLRIGVIGYGGMGTAHAQYINKGEVPNAVLGAVCDINPERLAKAKQSLGDDVQFFESADALFASKAIDAVIIATPHYDHPPLAIKALQTGHHAMVEKPAGVYTRQVREMNEVAAKSDKIFGIMFNQRTRGSHQKLRQLIASGELGEIRRTMYVITTWLRTQTYYDSGAWRGTWKGEGGGVLMNQSPHNLDLFQWVAGMPKRVRAFCSFGKYHKMETEDDVTAYLEYENGATGVFITSTGEAPGTQFFELVGDRGRVVLDHGARGEQITFWRTAEGVQHHIDTAKEGFSRPEIWRCEIPAGGGEEHKGVTKNFVNAILNGTPLLARGEEGINGVQLANAMHLSTWLNDWVSLPVDEAQYYAKLQEQVKNSTFKKDSKGKVLDVAGSY
jgi:predicted dehydrogenase